MSIRVIALFVVVAGLCIYAWKDWFKSLCGLILLTAVVAHPGFPESFAGIQGLNLWNIVFANVFVAWLMNRRRQQLLWDMPTIINAFLVLWLGVILVGWVRMIFDRSKLAGIPLTDLVSEQLINTIKWPLVGLPLFDGCRTRHRAKVVFACIFLLFAMFAVQIAREVPAAAALEPGNMNLRRKLYSELGLSPNGASKMMSGVPWAMLAMIPLLKKRYILLVLGGCVTSIYALALTGGRAGYIACGATVVLLCLIRWRKYILLLPLAVLILPIALPGTAERMSEGFSQTDVAGEAFTDTNQASSGRNLMWPVVIQKICESPVFGFGREAMLRTGLTEKLDNLYGASEGVSVAHPHNAYLEVLLDSGLIGFVIVVGLHTFILVYSARLFLDRGDPLYAAAGGCALALLTGHLVAFMGGQSFYAEEIDLGLWCAIGVMLRLYVARGRLLAKSNEQSINCQDTQHYQGHYNLTNTVGLG